MGALDLQHTRPFSMNETSQSPSLDDATFTLLSNAKSDATTNVAHSLDPNETSGATLDAEPDAQILEALRGKDRIYVLKLGEQMEALIKDRR